MATSLRETEEAWAEATGSMLVECIDITRACSNQRDRSAREVSSRFMSIPDTLPVMLVEEGDAAMLRESWWAPSES